MFCWVYVYAETNFISNTNQKMDDGTTFRQENFLSNFDAFKMYSLIPRDRDPHLFVKCSIAY